MYLFSKILNPLSKKGDILYLSFYIYQIAIKFTFFSNCNQEKSKFFGIQHILIIVLSFSNKGSKTLGLIFSTNYSPMFSWYSYIVMWKVIENLCLLKMKISIANIVYFIIGNNVVWKVKIIFIATSHVMANVDFILCFKLANWMRRKWGYILFKGLNYSIFIYA